MKYTQPKIVRTDNAVVAIQQVNNPVLSKPDGGFSDSAKICTLAAYEADE